MLRISLLIITLLVSGCNFAHLAQQGVGSAAGATLSFINPTAGVVGAAVGSVGIEVLDPLDTTQESTTDILEALPEEERLDALKNQQLWMTIESLGWYAGIIFLLIWFIPSPFDLFMRLFKR